MLANHLSGHRTLFYAWRGGRITPRMTNRDPQQRFGRSSQSNPVPTREEWDPIQAEGSLTAAFQGTAVSGQWVLRLRDTTVKELNDNVNRAAVWDAHGDGGVAGWEASVIV